jgi:hypothetical protein
MRFMLFVAICKPNKCLHTRSSRLETTMSRTYTPFSLLQTTLIRQANKLQVLSLKELPSIVTKTKHVVSTYIHHTPKYFSIPKSTPSGRQLFTIHYALLLPACLEYHRTPHSHSCISTRKPMPSIIHSHHQIPNQFINPHSTSAHVILPPKRQGKPPI